MVRDSLSILARRRNNFCQLLNVHRVNYFRQTEIHTAEPLVPQPSAFEVGMATEHLKRHRPPGTDQFPADLIKTGGIIFRSEMHMLINSVWNKVE